MDNAPAPDESASEAVPDGPLETADSDEMELSSVLDGEEVDPTDLVDYASRIAILAAFHSGPLPPAAEVAGYEQVLPGAADRLFAMLERKQQAELELERLRTTAEIEAARAEVGIAQRAGEEAAVASRRGQWMAGAVFAFILVISLVAVLKGQALEGILLAMTGLGTVLLALYGVNRLEQRKNDGPNEQQDRTDQESGSSD